MSEKRIIYMVFDSEFEWIDQKEGNSDKIKKIPNILYK